MHFFKKMVSLWSSIILNKGPLCTFYIARCKSANLSHLYDIWIKNYRGRHDQ